MAEAAGCRPGTGNDPNKVQSVRRGPLVGETQSVVAAPPQDDLASVGFEKTGIANQTGARDSRGQRPAWFCQEQTLVMTGQFSIMERNAFHISYLSDKIPEAVFHGQAVRTVAYLRVSTTQQGLSKTAIAKLTGVSRAALYSFMRTWGAQAEPLACISGRIWLVPFCRR